MRIRKIEKMLASALPNADDGEGCSRNRESLLRCQSKCLKFWAYEVSHTSAAAIIPSSHQKLCVRRTRTYILKETQETATIIVERHTPSMAEL